MKSPSQLEALRLIAAGRFYPFLVKEADGWFARWLPLEQANDAAICHWVDRGVRSAVKSALSGCGVKHPTVDDAFLAALRSLDGRVDSPELECEDLRSRLAEWRARFPEPPAVRSKLNFALSPQGDCVWLDGPVPKDHALLKALGEAVREYPRLKDLTLDSQGRLSMMVSKAEADDFLHYALPALRSVGFGAEAAMMATTLVAEAEIQSGAAGEQPPTVEYVVKIGGKQVTASEVRWLLEQEGSYAFFNGHYLELDRHRLRAALRLLEGGSKKISVAKALGMFFGVGASGPLDLSAVAAHGWLRNLVTELERHRDRASYEKLVAPASLAGTLRDYQLRALGWMRFLTRRGMGALLADDMGLGKTIEAIAWILSEREHGDFTGPVLVVAPLTLLANWHHELGKFAPTLRVKVHQGRGRDGAITFKRTVGEYDVVLTSYELLVRDYNRLQPVVWGALILDEAQFIRNPDTRVSRAARSLAVPRRLALTGTPVENGPLDLWGIEEFLNPGFLGPREDFEAHFVKHTSASIEKRLRRALEPFLLRRTKNDDQVAPELGQKCEVTEYCLLSVRQRREYEAALDYYRASERRKGDAFALITALKLACDGADGGVEGGKLERLFSLLEATFAAGESALVFTQYVKVGKALTEALRARYPQAVEFLHGGLSPRAREGALARFAAPGAKVFVLSLKAGGYGLNLAKAVHVIHYDRWWNPAVENQATDRAHRLGQKQTVFVHKFICEGTIEERVDELLAGKSSLFSRLIIDGEAFLRRLTPEELSALADLG